MSISNEMGREKITLFTIFSSRIIITVPLICTKSVKELSEPSLRFLQVIVMKSRASDKCLSSLSGYDFSLGLNFNQLSFSIFILFVSLPPTAMFLFGLVCWSRSRINLINLLCRSGL